MPEPPVRLGLIGFGHIGRALARLLMAKGDTTAYDMLADLITALRNERPDSRGGR